MAERIYHKDGTLPTVPGSIFVFGSNMAGQHAAGAALVAAERYGAIEGEPSGPMGLSYAIPTVSSLGEPMVLKTIQGYVQRFIDYTRLAYLRPFFVTRIGCGIAGFEDRQIAPMFRYAPRINVSLPEEWRPWVDDFGNGEFFKHERHK